MGGPGKAMHKIPKKILKYAIGKQPFNGQIYSILAVDSNRGHRMELFCNCLKWNLYHVPRRLPFTITLENGMKSLVYPDSDSGLTRIFNWSMDGKENAFIRNTLRPGDFIIDAGANVGNRTLVLADMIRGALLLDANPQCLERLRVNFGLNGLRLDNYHLVNKAVGARRGEVSFTDRGGTSCLNKIADAKEAAEPRLTKVMMTTIDDEMAQIGNPPCAFIKTDLEGYDLDALKGARRTLKDKQLRLVKFERWKSVPVADFQAFFADIGWQVFALDAEGRPSLNEGLIATNNNLFARPKALNP